MESSQNNTYKLQCENLDAVKELLTMVESDLKQLLSLDPNEIGSIAHNYQLYFSFLSGSYIENLYYQLVCKPSFTQEYRKATYVNSTETTLEEKWQILLEYAFKKGYNINIYEDLSKELDFVTNTFYNELNRYLKSELNNIITIREKVTHGQFIHSFDFLNNSIQPNSQRIIEDQDLFTIKRRIKKFNLIAKIILELITTPNLFLSNFDNYFNIFESLKYNYSADKYVEFLQQLRK